MNRAEYVVRNVNLFLLKTNVCKCKERKYVYVYYIERARNIAPPFN